MCLIEAAIKYPGSKPREEYPSAKILLFLFFFLFEDSPPSQPTAPLSPLCKGLSNVDQH